MTVAAEDAPPAVEYDTDGFQTDFPVTFSFQDEDDLVVYLDGSEVLTGFSITGGLYDEGTVVFDSAPATGVLTIVRLTDRAQLFSDSNTLDDTDHMRMADKAMYISQEQDRTLSRTIRLNPTDTESTLVLPDLAERTSKHIAFDSDGNLTVTTEAPTFEIKYTDPPITLVASQTDYPLPAEVQSEADEDNYEVRLIGGTFWTRGDDFTITSNVLTLTTAPTVANGLAGEEIEVTLVKPGIDFSSVSIKQRSVGSLAIALGAVLGEHFGFAGQELGTILYHDGSDWVVLDPPNTDGNYYQRLTVDAAGTTKVPSWELGALLNNYQYTSNNTVTLISATITDDDNKLTISEGQQILTRTFTLSPNVTNVRIQVLVYASCGNEETLRVGLFRVGTTDALREAYFHEQTHTGPKYPRTLVIDHLYATTSSGSVTFSVRIGVTGSTSYLNADTTGTRKGGGNISSTMVITEFGSRS